MNVVDANENKPLFRWFQKEHARRGVPDTYAGPGFAILEGRGVYETGSPLPISPECSWL